MGETVGTSQLDYHINYSCILWNSEMCTKGFSVDSVRPMSTVGNYVSPFVVCLKSTWNRLSGHDIYLFWWLRWWWLRTRRARIVIRYNEICQGNQSKIVSLLWISEWAFLGNLLLKIIGVFNFSCKLWSSRY